MAALSEHPLHKVVDLRFIRAVDLDLLLEEEVIAWQQRLNWDFRPSADLVRRFVDMQSLAGFALLQANRIAGYVYYVCEDRKGLVGDLYVIDAVRSIETENQLLSAALEALFATPLLYRVESQMMMISQPLSRPLPMPSQASVYARNFMEADLSGALPLPPSHPVATRVEPWQEEHQEEAARVIAAAYGGHIDSRINDQYRSPGGARRFLLNIVQYPGCGAFFQPASFVAVDRATRQLCGVCLASLVSEGVGHVTQICVTPEVRGTGTGYSLLRRSLLAFAAHGCSRVSLTVTGSNDTAISLYRRAGFKNVRNFAAYVWENF